MQSGKLRHRVTIKNFTSAPDATGQVIDSWSTLATVWAKVSPQSGTEKTNEGTSNIHEVHNVKIRYTGDIKPTYRLLYKTRILNIKSIGNLDERDRTMKLVCTENIT